MFSPCSLTFEGWTPSRFFPQLLQVLFIYCSRRSNFLTNGFCLYSMSSDLWLPTTGMRTTPPLLFMSKTWTTTRPCLTGHSMRRRSLRRMTAACQKIFSRSWTAERFSIFPSSFHSLSSSQYFFGLMSLNALPPLIPAPMDWLQPLVSCVVMLSCLWASSPGMAGLTLLLQGQHMKK